MTLVAAPSAMARGALAATVIAITLAITLVACGQAPPGTIPPTGVPPTDAPVSLEPSATASGPAPMSSTPATASATSEPTPATQVIEDESLLAILPEAVGGVAVRQEAIAFQEAATDPDFVANVDAAVFAVAVDEANLASAVVARLRPGVFSEPFFRDWRDSYDDGACAQSGGVAGNAETELGGRTTYITTCAGGLTAYHAYLEERDVVVSLISVGERRLGEQLMRDLRP